MARDDARTGGTDGRNARRLREAAPHMFDTLMYFMHHPCECSPAAREMIRQVLEEAGMDYERDVASARDERLKDSVERMREANAKA